MTGSALMFRVPPEHLRIVWVANYYDGPLSGLCRVNGKLQRFERGLEGHRYRVYSLTPRQRALWVLQWRLFELFVGTHWSYPRGSARGWWPSRWRRAMSRVYYRWIAERITP